MATDSVPCLFNVVDQNEATKFAPVQFQAFLDCFNEIRTSFEVFAKAAKIEGGIDDLVEDDSEYEKASLAYINLRETFELATNGLELCLCHHDSDVDGSAHDEVSGVFWHVQNVWQYTSAARFAMKHGLNIERLGCAITC